MLNSRQRKNGKKFETGIVSIMFQKLIPIIVQKKQSTAVEMRMPTLVPEKRNLNFIFVPPAYANMIMDRLALHNSIIPQNSKKINILLLIETIH